MGAAGAVSAEGMTARLFAGLFTDYDLIAVDGASIAIPKDGSIPVFTGSTLSEIALQIASHREAGR